MNRIIVLLTTVIWFASCGNQHTENTDVVMPSVITTEKSFNSVTGYADKSEDGETTNTETEKIPTDNSISSGQKILSQIIKNASVQFQVKNIETTHQKIVEILKQYNAYFADDNNLANANRIDNNMTIRVPAFNFEKLLEALMQESVYTNYKNISAQDVTAEFVDVETRLKTKKEAEQRYLVLLKQAKSIKEIIEVENSLRIIREEIESTEGRLKLMKDQIGYSTINLNTYQNLDYVPQPQMGIFSTLKEAFINGWRGFVSFLVGLVRIWPFVILLGGGIFLIVRKIRKRKNQNRM